MSDSVREPPRAAFPTRVGRYELLVPIGRGGMAKVYLARISGVGGFERRFALKLMHDHLRDEPEWTAHLLDEARLAGRLRHPNLVPVVDAGEDAVGVFLVMDYVEGEVLSGLTREQRKKGGRIPQPIALRILSDALVGLHAAHGVKDDSGVPLGLVHRDFSPQNILVGIDGVSRLTDFGIAKVANRTVLTRTGLVKGKVGYMSPEQARGIEVDRRTDVWAAGVLAWELLSGERLYPLSDDMATLFSIVSEEPRTLRSADPGISQAVEACVMHALRKDREQRFETAEAFRLALMDAWNAPIADTAAVARYVLEVAGPTLSAREREIELVIDERAQGHSDVRRRFSEPISEGDETERRATDGDDAETLEKPANTAQTLVALAEDGATKTAKDIADEDAAGRDTANRDAASKPSPGRIIAVSLVGVAMIASILVWQMVPRHPSPSLSSTNAARPESAVALPPSATEAIASAPIAIPERNAPLAVAPSTQAHSSTKAASPKSNARSSAKHGNEGHGIGKASAKPKGSGALLPDTLGGP